MNQIFATDKTVSISDISSDLALEILSDSLLDLLDFGALALSSNKTDLMHIHKVRIEKSAISKDSSKDYSPDCLSISSPIDNFSGQDGLSRTQSHSSSILSPAPSPPPSSGEKHQCSDDEYPEHKKQQKQSTRDQHSNSPIYNYQNINLIYDNINQINNNEISIFKHRKLNDKIYPSLFESFKISEYVTGSKNNSNHLLFKSTITESEFQLLLLTRRFWLKSLPSLSVRQYLERIHKFCKLSTSMYLATSYFIYKICIDLQLMPLNENNVYRLISACLRVSGKLLEDLNHKPTFFSDICGLSRKDLSRIELGCLYLCNFDMFISEQILHDHLNTILKTHKRLKNLKQNNNNSNNDNDTNDLISTSPPMTP